jgi:hypothetical protein
VDVSNKELLLWLGAGAAFGLGVFWWRHKDEPGSLVDKVADAVVELTSSDESRLSQMQPDAQAQTRALIQQLADQGIGVHVGQTLRTSAQEKAEVDSGHSSATLKVSWHQLGRAVDLYPLNDDGSADYSGTNLDAIRAIANTAEQLGFRQLAFNSDGSKHIIQSSKGPIWDSGHIEWRAPYNSISEAVAAEGADYGLA